MDSCERTRQLLIMHYQTYPHLQVQDVLKFLHQSAFGCEHLVSSRENATAYIESEYAHIDHTTPALVEPLDGRYGRVSLSCLNKGLCAETLGKLFVASAKIEADGTARLLEKLAVAKALVDEGALPFDTAAFSRAVDEWRENGYTALHHSEAFRAAYAPSYRVIANEYLPFLPLFAALDTRLAAGRVTLAVEGGSASGKTTLARMLKTLYDATVFHMDDFFLQAAQRTPERYAQVGGNLDRERFLAQVLLPLAHGDTVTYQPFDCTSMCLGDAVQVVPQSLVVAEGVYSMHPDLASHYTFSVFLDVSDTVQKARIEKRNTPAMATRFFEEWIPLERTYFSKMQVKERCDMSIDITQ